VEVQGSTVARYGYRPRLSDDQAALLTRVQALLEKAQLTPPSMKELVEAEGTQSVEDILRLMEDEGLVRGVDGQHFFWRTSLETAGFEVVLSLGGSSGLGPSDFREVIPVTRKHLVPLLRYFDTVGITTRTGDKRRVATSLPAGWGTPRSPNK
jgi:hypothetical protein